MPDRWHRSGSLGTSGVQGGARGAGADAAAGLRGHGTAAPPATLAPLRRSPSSSGGDSGRASGGGAVAASGTLKDITGFHFGDADAGAPPAHGPHHAQHSQHSQHGNQNTRRRPHPPTQQQPAPPHPGRVQGRSYREMYEREKSFASQQQQRERESNASLGRTRSLPTPRELTLHPHPPSATTAKYPRSRSNLEQRHVHNHRGLVSQRHKQHVVPRLPPTLDRGSSGARSPISGQAPLQAIGAERPHPGARPSHPQSPSSTRRRRPPHAAGGAPSTARRSPRSPRPQRASASTTASSSSPRGGRALPPVAWRVGPPRPVTAVDGARPFYGAASYAGATAAGVTKENQDGFFVCLDGAQGGTSGSSVGPGGAAPTAFVAGVLDGHGVNGRRVSDFAKGQLALRIADEYEAGRGGGSLEVPRGLAAAYSDTATALQSTGIDVRQSGTTAVTCMRVNNQLFVANVGDSRCVLARADPSGRGLRAMPLSRDHKPDAPPEKERIFRCGGYVEPTHYPGHGFQGPPRVWQKRQQEGGLAVSRSIGDIALRKAGVIPNPEVLTQPVSLHDKFVVMASDGVWDCMSNEEVVNIAAQHADPRAAADAVTKTARRRWVQGGGGYVDDITTVVVRLEG